jgi:hypothetical protein
MGRAFFCHPPSAPKRISDYGGLGVPHFGRNSADARHKIMW